MHKNATKNKDNQGNLSSAQILPDWIEYTISSRTNEKNMKTERKKADQIVSSPIELIEKINCGSSSNKTPRDVVATGKIDPLASEKSNELSTRSQHQSLVTSRSHTGVSTSTGEISLEGLANLKHLKRSKSSAYGPVLQVFPADNIGYANSVERLQSRTKNQRIIGSLEDHYSPSIFPERSATFSSKCCQSLQIISGEKKLHAKRSLTGASKRETNRPDVTAESPNQLSEFHLMPGSTNLQSHVHNTNTERSLKHDAWQESKINLWGSDQEQNNSRSWDPLRLQWLERLSHKNKVAYFRATNFEVDGKLAPSLLCSQAFPVNSSKNIKGLKFTLFPLLPAEIRNQVWECARQNCSSSCYVQLDVKQAPGGTYQKIRGKLELVPHPILDAKFTYLYNIPGLFGACRESRSIVNEFYGRPKLIAYNRETKKPYPSGQGSCRLNYEHDRLFIITRGTTTQLPEFLDLMKREEQVRIKHIAIPLKDYFLEASKVVHNIARLTNLETLDLIIGDGKDDLRQIGSKDYGHRFEKSLRKYHKIEDLQRKEKHRNRWLIPKVKIEYVNEIQARIWGIDCLQWDRTTRPIRY
ncbi:BgTH12-06245 [Blumeria graminis f. sp. triticale]|uniref:BgTH12-06245 n=1 Tax=Blumeria graminis f. sp. triticale TaxID=1689686 RepID=A0A9W4D3C2_BLUGR|nr:BgTH12-06245 [Blumeria graminis f. sp. triticale]